VKIVFSTRTVLSSDTIKACVLCSLLNIFRGLFGIIYSQVSGRPACVYFVQTPIGHDLLLNGFHVLEICKIWGLWCGVMRKGEIHHALMEENWLAVN
jgi:hypothetical protein